MSDAVDRAIAQIDFSDLAGQKVFFETKYITNTRDPSFQVNQKSLGFVNGEYITSSLRQQMVAADLRLQDKIEDADFVVEARVGTVGMDNNEVVYGIPASTPLSSAASSVFAGSPIPSIPEISVARKNIQVGAAKVGVFAYDRRTRQPVWQAGISQAMSDARDSWILGVGPFQRGTIYKGGTRFAGSRLSVPGLSKLPPVDSEEPASAEQNTHSAPGSSDPLTSYYEGRLFHTPSAINNGNNSSEPTATASTAKPDQQAPSAGSAQPASVQQTSASSVTTPGQSSSEPAGGKPANQEPRPIGSPPATPVAAPSPPAASSSAASSTSGTSSPP